MSKSVATVPVVVKSPTDETMVLSIEVGDVVEDKIQQFILQHELGNEIFAPILQHVKSLLADEENVKSKSPQGSSKKMLSNASIRSPKLTSNSSQSYPTSYEATGLHDPPFIQRLSTDNDDDEEYLYNRARGQQQDDWSPAQPLQPTYNEINMSSNNSLSGRRSRSNSLGGNGANKQRSRSLSPSSLSAASRTRRNDAFQRLYEDAEKSRKRKQDMGIRLDEEMWRSIEGSKTRYVLVTTSSFFLFIYLYY